LVFNKKSVFHILPALCTWKGEQWVAIGRGGCGRLLLLLQRSLRSIELLLLLSKSFQQFLLSGTSLLLPA
jgi:hypothetical protein